MPYGSEGLEFDVKPFSLVSGSGLELWGCVDAVPGELEKAPVIVVPPAFGRTMRDSVILGWYLLSHGFRVVRYDNTSHLGLSEGEILNFTLGGAVEDLSSVVDYVKRELQVESVGVVGTSLSFRVAVRALRDRDDVRLLFGLVGTAQVRHTIAEVIGLDVFGMTDRGEHLESSYRVDGHVIRTHSFVRDAIGRGLDTLEGTRSEIKACDFPVVVVSGEEDAWVALEDVKIALSGAATGGALREVVVLPGVSHQLGKNPIATALALAEMTVRCVQEVGGRELTVDEVTHPTVTELVRVRKVTAHRRALSLAPIESSVTAGVLGAAGLAHDEVAP